MKKQIRMTSVNVMKKKKAKGNCSISVLSNMVTTGHMWPFEFKLLELNLKFSSSFALAVFQVLNSEVTQSCPTLCDSMDCSPSGFSIHGVFQARILEWVVISFSRGSSPARDRTQVSCIEGRCFTL